MTQQSGKKMPMPLLSNALAKVQYGKHHQHISINGHKTPDAKKKSILLSTC